MTVSISPGFCHLLKGHTLGIARAQPRKVNVALKNSTMQVHRAAGDQRDFASDEAALTCLKDR